MQKRLLGAGTETTMKIERRVEYVLPFERRVCGDVSCVSVQRMIKILFSFEKMEFCSASS